MYIFSCGVNKYFEFVNIEGLSESLRIAPNAPTCIGFPPLKMSRESYKPQALPFNSKFPHITGAIFIALSLLCHHGGCG